MKKIGFLFALILTSSAPTFAKTITAKINGMVCAFCAQGIEKKFKSEDSVKDVHVDLDAKTVKIELKAEKEMSHDTVKGIIVGAGYEVESIDGVSSKGVADQGAN